MRKKLILLAVTLFVTVSVTMKVATPAYANVLKNWVTSGNFSLFNSGSGGRDVGITQGLVTDANSMTFTTSDASGAQAARVVLPGGVDNGNIDFYSGKRGSEILRFRMAPWGLAWGYSAITNDQGGSLELGGMGTPYLDFRNDTASDYDARFILASDDMLIVDSAELRTRNSFPLVSENSGNASSVDLGWNGNQARIRLAGSGLGSLSGLSILQGGNAEILKIDEDGGRAELTTGYGGICIGNC